MTALPGLAPGEINQETTRARPTMPFGLAGSRVMSLGDFYKLGRAGRAGRAVGLLL